MHTEDISVVPIGAYYVAAVLKENHYDVEILNWYNINQAPHRIEEILREKKPDVIELFSESESFFRPGYFKAKEKQLCCVF
jgi:hypothetical protein